MIPQDEQVRAMVEAYDGEAEATGWLGPEVAFGLAYQHIQPGQSVLDIGIGTGLGSVLFRKAGLKVYGMDVSPEMLEACRSGETARLLRKGGLFVFVVGDRTENEAPEILVGTEHTQSGAPVTMYRHGARQIKGWLVENGFAPLRSLAFSVPMDREKTQSLRASAYLVRRS
jgi:SAM-dependent methyltransferase